MNVAVLHDFFDKRGGGERVALALAKAFDADLYTGFVDRDRTYSMKGVRVKSFNLQAKNPLMRGRKIWKKFESLDADYDLYIFSGTWCISAAKNLKPNILYMHTPPRFLYDLREHFENGMNPIKKAIFRRFCESHKINDQIAARQFGGIAVNSGNTMKRVMKYYGVDIYKKCKIVNPPVDTKKFSYRKSEEFYLSTSRLDALKRIDIIIEAFARNGRRLIIASMGPDEPRLKKLAAGHANIEFTGKLDEKTLIDLYSRCKATVAAAVDEDFGLVAVESMAAGKPCIAVNEGGFLETVNEGKTGIFFAPDAESLDAAIMKAEKIKWNHKSIMREAKKYDTKEFEKKMRVIATHVMKSCF